MPADYYQTTINDFIFPQCNECKYYKGGLACEAFTRIPSVILNNTVDHKEAYPGDKGIRYEEK